MTKMGVNIYKEARKKAEFKREPAAEELGIAVRTLDKYESFELRVPDDIVTSIKAPRLHGGTLSVLSCPSSCLT